MAKSLCALIALTLCGEGAHAFVGYPRCAATRDCAALRAHDVDDAGSKATSRREWIRDASAAAFGIGAALSIGPAIAPEPAFASGGATAGGAYLLSAKQRYNKRVTAGVTAFLALSGDVEGGNLKSAKAYFETEEEGGWKDSAAAGYLLANAFRTNSTTPPDKLPAVKKWKAFMASVENMKKAVKKKDKGGALDSYKTAVEALDGYLSAVELPPSIEMSQ